MLQLKVVHERGRTGFEEHKDFPIRINSLIAARYQVKEYLGSAAFSKAVQCVDLHSGELVRRRDQPSAYLARYRPIDEAVEQHPQRLSPVAPSSRTRSA